MEKVIGFSSWSELLKAIPEYERLGFECEVHGWIVPPEWWQEPADMLHVGDELIWNDGSISVVLAVNGSTFHELTQFGYVTEQCYADPGTAPGWKRTGAHYKIEDVIKKMMEHSKIDEEDEYEE